MKKNDAQKMTQFRLRDLLLLGLLLSGRDKFASLTMTIRYFVSFHPRYVFGCLKQKQELGAHDFRVYDWADTRDF